MSRRFAAVCARGLVPAKRRLEGKVAIITGGVGGIGVATARLFTEHGANVLLADVGDASAAKKLFDEIGLNLASYVHCDVSKEEDVSAAVDLAVEMHGRLDIMFNNAGIVDKHLALRGAVETEMEDFDRVMSVNARGVMVGIKHAARVMIPNKRGSIISTASAAGVLGGLASYAYTASKHAIIGLTKNGAAELGKYGIRVNCISPFLFASPMSTEYFKHGDFAASDEDAKSIVEKLSHNAANLKGRIHKAEDMAEAALYLASDEAAYVSGHNLVIDGGFTVVSHAL